MFITHFNVKSVMNMKGECTGRLGISSKKGEKIISVWETTFY